MTRAGTRWKPWHLVVVLLAGLLLAVFLDFELSSLSVRPMHADEAVHAVKFNTLYQGGGYRYDPGDYHGPTLYYLAWPIVRGCGVERFGQMEAWMLRLVPLLGLLGCVGMVAALGRFAGRSPPLAAMALVVLHPAAAFYATSFIQETLLVLLTLATILSARCYLRRRRAGWALCVGACAGLMLATKETAVIHLAAMAAAGAVVLWARGHGSPGRPWRPRWGLWSGAALVGLVLWQSLITAGFTHLPAAGDSFRTFWLQIGRAAGGDHRHLWPLHYFGLLLGHGGLWRALPNAILLICAIVGGVVAWLLPPGWKGRGLLRFLALYTLLVMAVYSLLPYKTPWLVLTWLVPMFLLFDIGSSVALGFLRLKARWALPVGFLLIAAVFPLLGRNRWQDGRSYDDPACPWAYAPTHRSLAALSGRVEQIATAWPSELPVVVIAPADDYWPLPWQLRRLQHVGYFDHVPDGLAGPVILVHEDLAEQVAAELYSHRPGQNPLYVRLVDRRIWLRPGVEMIGLVRKSVLDAAEAGP